MPILLLLLVFISLVHINIRIGIFILSTLISLIIALATILLHVYKASVRNPVEALIMD